MKIQALKFAVFAFVIFNWDREQNIVSSWKGIFGDCQKKPWQAGVSCNLVTSKAEGACLTFWMQTETHSMETELPFEAHSCSCFVFSLIYCSVLLHMCGKMVFANNNIPEFLLAYPSERRNHIEDKSPFRMPFSFLSHIVTELKCKKLWRMILCFHPKYTRLFLTVNVFLWRTFSFTELKWIYLRRITLFTLCSSTQSCLVFSACGWTVWKERNKTSPNIHLSFMSSNSKLLFFSHWVVPLNVENHPDQKGWIHSAP